MRTDTRLGRGINCVASADPVDAIPSLAAPRVLWHLTPAPYAASVGFVPVTLRAAAWTPHRPRAPRGEAGMAVTAARWRGPAGWLGSRIRQRGVAVITYNA